jgi:predicted nuclease of predicted toxin-antitoxin system
VNGTWTLHRAINMKFKLDENFGPNIAEIFSEHGYEASTVFEEDLCSSPDNHIFKVCQQEGYCLISMDKDFANILNFPPQSSHGIVVIRLPKRPELKDIYDHIRLFLKAVIKVSISGKLWIVEHGRIREYQGNIE